MFHPVGDMPPSVYWRRRFAFLASLVALIVLIVLTVRVLGSSGASTPAAGGGTNSSHPVPAGSTGTSAPATSSSGHSPSPTGPRTTPKSGHPSSGSSASSAAPARCRPSQLSLTAAVGQQSYQVGDAPVLSIVVQNRSNQPCVQDLADPQIVMRVYNGESRVWGSHDCKVEAGTDDRTLEAGASVRVSIVWSGLSSQPGDCNSRQRVGAGTYTLYASLSGREGAAAQFTIR